jgi:hypothetical protein
MPKNKLIGDLGNVKEKEVVGGGQRGNGSLGSEEDYSRKRVD